MNTVTLYHNPNCSKSRAALSLLEQQALSLQVIYYVDTPLSSQQLLTLKQQLKCSSLRQMMRVNDDLYQQLKLEQADEATLLQMLLTHPILMQRPIIQMRQQAIIGRPVEHITAFIDQQHD